MHRKIFSFIRSRPLDAFGLAFFSVLFFLALHDHAMTAAIGRLSVLCGLISTALGPHISVKLTLPEIRQAFSQTEIPRHQKLRRVFQGLCLGLLGLYLYSAFTSS